MALCSYPALYGTYKFSEGITTCPAVESIAFNIDASDTAGAGCIVQGEFTRTTPYPDTEEKKCCTVQFENGKSIRTICYKSADRNITGSYPGIYQPGQIFNRSQSCVPLGDSPGKCYPTEEFESVPSLDTNPSCVGLESGYNDPQGNMSGNPERCRKTDVYKGDAQRCALENTRNLTERYMQNGAQYAVFYTCDPENLQTNYITGKVGSNYYNAIRPYCTQYPSDPRCSLFCTNNSAECTSTPNDNNPEESFWDKYGKYILIGLIVLAVLIVAIILIFYFIKKHNAAKTSTTVTSTSGGIYTPVVESTSYSGPPPPSYAPPPLPEGFRRL